MIASSYPFLEVFWTMCIFFALVCWLWILFIVLGDIFRRHDISGSLKVVWIVFLIVLPFIGTFVYIIAEHAGMAGRSVEARQTSQAEFEQYVRSAAGRPDPAEIVARAQKMYESGAINRAEFDSLTQNAGAGSQ